MINLTKSRSTKSTLTQQTTATFREFDLDTSTKHKGENISCKYALIRKNDSTSART